MSLLYLHNLNLDKQKMLQNKFAFQLNTMNQEEQDKFGLYLNLFTIVNIYKT